MNIKTLSIITATLLLTGNTYAEEDIGEITVISATKTTQTLENTPSNVEVITAQDIEDRGYTTVSQALSSTAGISTVSNGGLGQSTSVFVRGMGNKYTLVLIDGIRYNDPTSNGAPWADLMVDDIERIEVVKGAQSGIWGADASAGVINIITKNPQKGFHTSAHLEGGSFGTWKYGATVSNASDIYYLKLSYDIVDTDGFTTIAPYGKEISQYENDEYKNKTLNIKAGYSFNMNNKIDLIHTLIEGKGDADPFVNYMPDPDGDYHLESTYKFSKASLTHQDQYETLNIYAQRSDFSRTYPDDAFNQHFDGKIDEYGINSKITYREKDFVLIGLDRKTYSYDNTLNESYDASGFFLTNYNKFEGMLGGTTVLTESLRYDNYDAFNSKTTGKIGLKHIHDHIKGLVTSFNYGTAYNIPTIYNLFDPFSGNKDLKPESTKSYDITVAYKDFKVTYFNNLITDMIDYVSQYDSDGNWMGGQYHNLEGDSKIDGIELSYKKEVWEKVFLNTNYSKFFTIEDTNKKELARRPKETLNLAFDYYGIEKLHLGAEAQYIGERYDQSDEQGQQTGKYTLFNMTADYQITDNIQVYAKIENIGDKYYQNTYGYATSPRAFYLGIKGKI